MRLDSIGFQPVTQGLPRLREALDELRQIRNELASDSSNHALVAHLDIAVTSCEQNIARINDMIDHACGPSFATATTSFAKQLADLISED
jgi:hypothetical protein